ncbi:MAG: hypothetical protein Q8S31_10230 [Alphaproteobacteria bacterium]|nr:hypothetical protein [Alphaproteobacteria bacterium]
MKRTALLVISLVIGFNFFVQAESLPGEKFTLIETTVNFTNVDKDGKITRERKVTGKKIIPHNKPGEPVDKKEIVRLAHIAKQEQIAKRNPSDTETLGLFDEVADFIDHAKKGVGGLVSSGVGFVTGLIADEAVGAVAGILVP